MDGHSLQERYAPASRCFGCGPANPDGLHLRSFEADDGWLSATWQPEARFEAFDDALNGGIVGTLLDCHGNWAAVTHLMHARAAAEAPGCVTAELSIRYHRPTPTRLGPLTVRSHVIEASADRATVEATVAGGDGILTATARGTFVAVRPGHPGHDRWRG
ncbi:MAG: PaaI family thioesterase [Chloroflexi bacterium]|nr:PaaI family thioesterase [Chloroflexota bacterium]